MKKRKVIIIVSLALITLTAALIFFLTNHTFEYLYQGDRMTLTVDGKIKGIENNIMIDFSVSNTDLVNCDKDTIHINEKDPLKVSVKGNEYGKYTFNIPVYNRQLNVEIFHANWWQIVDCNVEFELDVKNDSMTYHITDKQTETQSETIYPENDIYTIYYMP